MSWISQWWDQIEDVVSGAWEWVKEVWDDFFTLAVENINEFFDKLGMYFIIGVGLIIVGVAGWVSGLFSWIWSGLSTIGGWISSAWGKVATWATSLYNYWKGFADWIHLDELRKAHEIGQIVSPEYREAVEKVYDQIAEVSEDLGLGAGFMLLALSDARNLVLDTTSLFGHPYDMAESEWVGSLGGFLSDFNEKAEDYKNNPSGLIIDIQNYFEPDMISARSGFQVTMMTFMETTITGLETTVGEVVKLKGSLEQAILHLPEQISKPIYVAM